MVGEECEKNGDKRKIRLSNHDIWCERTLVHADISKNYIKNGNMQQQCNKRWLLLNMLLFLSWFARKWKVCSKFRSPHLPLDRLVEYGPFNPQNETCFLRWPTTVATKEITVTFTVKRKDSPKKWKTSRQKEKDSLQKKKPPSPHALFYAAKTLLFFLPRGYFFSRESFTFNLPWRLFFLLWGFFFSREAFPFSREVLHFAVSIFLCWEVISFTVTVVGHLGFFDWFRILTSPPWPIRRRI